jgi:hypothetical protein
VPGRHHTDTPPGGSVPSPIGTLVIVAIAVVAVLAGLAAIAAWVAPIAGGDDDLAIAVQPSPSLSGPPATLDESNLDGLFPSIPPSAAPTASASPSGSSPPTASALMVSSTSRAAPSTVAPSPAAGAASATPSRSRVPDALTASYSVTSSTADGFTAAITVRNPTAAAQSWTMVLTYPSGTRITVTRYWNATPHATGRRLRFDGGPLPAGASYGFGFQAGTDPAQVTRPTACTINGTSCTGF